MSHIFKFRFIHRLKTSFNMRNKSRSCWKFTDLRSVRTRKAAVALISSIWGRNVTSGVAAACVSRDKNSFLCPFVNLRWGQKRLCVPAVVTHVFVDILPGSLVSEGLIFHQTRNYSSLGFGCRGHEKAAVEKHFKVVTCPPSYLLGGYFYRIYCIWCRIFLWFFQQSPVRLRHWLVLYSCI